MMKPSTYISPLMSPFQAHPTPKAQKQHHIDLNNIPSSSPISSTSPMASKPSIMVLAAATLVVMLNRAYVSAQNNCTTAIVGLSPCLSYITGNNTNPSDNCCSQLAGVVKSEPQCLCMVLNGGASQYGLTLNTTQALALPDACNIKTPPVSQCKNAAAGPTGSPTARNSPTPSTSSGGSGSKATSGVNESAGSIAKMSFSLGFFLILLASHA